MSEPQLQRLQCLGGRLACVCLLQAATESMNSSVKLVIGDRRHSLRPEKVTNELLIRLVRPLLEEAEPIIRHAAHLWAATQPQRLLRPNDVDSSTSNSDGEESCSSDTVATRSTICSTENESSSGTVVR